MINKRRWVFLVVAIFLFSISYVGAWPPSPPNINLTPPAPKCTVTNGGVEICDNIDNDCDSRIDEDINTSVGCNQVGYCYGSYKVCTAGNWSVCSKLPGQETCNAVDDDCNGLLNNGLPNININTSCTVSGTYGVCLSGLRYQYCNASVTSYTWTSCASYILPSSEKCNGLDDDCDNSVDENLTNSSGCNQVGYCLGAYKTCINGGWLGSCSKLPGTEVCNNVDDDCDGQKDEDLFDSSGCNQVGYCSGAYKMCVSGGWPGPCSKVPISETCNNVDDNCNNLVDDGVSRPTSCGIGECSGNSGVQICTNGEWTTDTCNPYEGAIPEICEGSKDEDCDGTTDENCTCNTGSIKTCGYSNIGACKLGNQTCNNGFWSSVCTGAVYPEIEICDGIDNDCDGETDENLTDVSDCSQLGVCRGAFRTCSAGNWSVCSIIPNPETCNNFDDDCNGRVDDNLTSVFDCNQEGYCSGAFRTCSAGNWSSCSKTPISETCNDIDDDCDGVFDENDICYVPPSRTNPDAGGDTGKDPYIPPTVNNTIQNKTDFPSGISDNKSGEPPEEKIINNSLLEVVPLQDKVENISKSGANTNLFSTFKEFSTKKMIIVGIILAAIIIFLSVFIIDFSKRKRRSADDRYLNSLYSSGLTYLGMGKQRRRAAKNMQVAALPGIKDNQNIANVGMNSANGSNGYMQNYQRMTIQEINALKYIDAMRQKGYSDEYIMNQLRIKGWKEEVIYGFFRN